MVNWEHFTADELECPCGKCDGGTMAPSFMVRLVELRKHIGFSFPVSSAFRCPSHNEAVGGASKSYHLKGRAVDIELSHDQAYQVIAAAKKFGFRGVGVNQKGGGRFVHLDNRLQETVTLFSY